MCSDLFDPILQCEIQPRHPLQDSRCPTERSSEEQAEAATFSCKGITPLMGITKPTRVNRRIRQRRGEYRHIDEWLRVSHNNQFARRRQVGAERGAGNASLADTARVPATAVYATLFL